MKKETIETNEEIPVCEKCGNALVKENSEWKCPHCHGEIDFFGDDEKLD